MQNFLLVYDRAAGTLVEEQIYDDRREALAERFALEQRTERIEPLSACSSHRALRADGDPRRDGGPRVGPGPVGLVKREA